MSSLIIPWKSSECLYILQYETKKSQRIEFELYVPVYSADQILDFLLVERSYMKNWSQI